MAVSTKRAPRRRVLRTSRPDVADQSRHLARLRKKHEQLEKEQAALARWMTKLKRSFHAVEKQQQKVSRLEREIARLNQTT